LGQVLDDRLRVAIREKLGDAYAPEAGSDTSDTFTGYGLMIAEVGGAAPERAAEIAAAVRRIAGDLQAHGVTADELTRAKEPILTALRDSVRTNPYWLAAVLSRCQEYPDRLDWARSRQTDIAAITQAELSDLAKRYLAPEAACQVTARPAAAAPAKP
jgi:zinc protease